MSASCIVAQFPDKALIDMHTSTWAHPHTIVYKCAKRMPAHTNTLIHMCANMHTYVYTHAYMSTHMRTCVHTHTCTCTHARAHTETHSNTHARTRSHTRLSASYRRRDQHISHLERQNAEYAKTAEMMARAIRCNLARRINLQTGGSRWWWRRRRVIASPAGVGRRTRIRSPIPSRQYLAKHNI